MVRSFVTGYRIELKTLDTYFSLNDNNANRKVLKNTIKLVVASCHLAHKLYSGSNRKNNETCISMLCEKSSSKKNNCQTLAQNVLFRRTSNPLALRKTMVIGHLQIDYDPIFLIQI